MQATKRQKQLHFLRVSENCQLLTELHIIQDEGQPDETWFGDRHLQEIVILLRDPIKVKVVSYYEQLKRRRRDKTERVDPKKQKEKEDSTILTGQSVKIGYYFTTSSVHYRSCVLPREIGSPVWRQDRSSHGGGGFSYARLFPRKLVVFVCNHQAGSAGVVTSQLRKSMCNTPPSKSLGISSYFALKTAEESDVFQCTDSAVQKRSKLKKIVSGMKSSAATMNQRAQPQGGGFLDALLQREGTHPHPVLQQVSQAESEPSSVQTKSTVGVGSNADGHSALPTDTREVQSAEDSWDDLDVKVCKRANVRKQCSITSTSSRELEQSTKIDPTLKDGTESLKSTERSKIGDDVQRSKTPESCRSSCPSKINSNSGDCTTFDDDQVTLTHNIGQTICGSAEDRMLPPDALMDMTNTQGALVGVCRASPRLKRKGRVRNKLSLKKQAKSGQQSAESMKHVQVREESEGMEQTSHQVDRTSAESAGREGAPAVGVRMDAGLPPEGLKGDANCSVRLSDCVLRSKCDSNGHKESASPEVGTRASSKRAQGVYDDLSRKMDSVLPRRIPAPVSSCSSDDDLVAVSFLHDSMPNGRVLHGEECMKAPDVQSKAVPSSLKEDETSHTVISDNSHTSDHQGVCVIDEPESAHARALMTLPKKSKQSKLALAHMKVQETLATSTAGRWSQHMPQSKNTTTLKANAESKKTQQMNQSEQDQVSTDKSKTSQGQNLELSELRTGDGTHNDISSMRAQGACLRGTKRKTRDVDGKCADLEQKESGRSSKCQKQTEDEMPFYIPGDDSSDGEGSDMGVDGEGVMQEDQDGGTGSKESSKKGNGDSTDDGVIDLSQGGDHADSGSWFETMFGDKRYVRELTEDDIASLTLRNRLYLKRIFTGKIACERHQLYKNKPTDRLSLAHRVRLGPFRDEQMDAVMGELVKIYCKRHFKYMDYISKVLLPEAMAKIYMDVHSVSHAQAEQVIQGVQEEQPRC